MPTIHAPRRQERLAPTSPQAPVGHLGQGPHVGPAAMTKMMRKATLMTMIRVAEAGTASGMAAAGGAAAAQAAAEGAGSSAVQEGGKMHGVGVRPRAGVQQEAAVALV